ncbi:MAG: hypothetical protein DRQ49_13420 [Gammaproteobacteria bacterium]|nr:MAG: hypothetical protein DRQ49_13420 [Gammaproteobacteria bacterium]RKZ73937.1 MAG: hypothetical protein DRQ57_12785 [Gammaproteobacteria bacterium]
MYRTLMIFGLVALAPPLAMAEDVGDTPGEAKSISRSVKDTLTSAADVDFYKFTIRANRDNPDSSSGNLTVTLSQKAPPSFNPQSGWQVDLYTEANLANVLYTAILPETSLEVDFEQGLSPGTYYLRVYSLDSAVFPAAEYTLEKSWEESPYYEKQPNDKPDSANAIIFNEVYYGNLSSESDVDFYRFGLEVPDLVTISLSQKTPSFDSTIGWQLSLFSQSQTVDVPSTTLSGTLQANLEAGMHYLFVKPLPQEVPEEVAEDETEAEETEKEEKLETAPVGRRYELLVTAPSVPQQQSSECPFVFTYAQNPLTNRWASFSTPCDVPVGWASQQTAPETFEVCPSPHASYTLPQMDELGTPIAGRVKIPLLDYEDEQGNAYILRVELVQTPSIDPIQFIPDGLKMIRIIEAEVEAEVEIEVTE